MTINRILHCDALTGLGALPPASVPLTVTSPPFDQARDYGGHVFNFQAIAEELWRVTGRPRAVEYGYRGDVWAYMVGGNRTAKEVYAHAHPALMPELLARDLILSYSDPGDLVLDICAGAGTTCKMALLTGRRHLGFEPWGVAYDLAERRMTDAHRTLVGA